MEVMIEKSIKVRDSIFDPNIGEKVAYYYEGSNEKTFYKVWMFLDGRDTPYVDYVTYKLHPTFPNPVKNVKRSISNPNCSLVIWAWGTFKAEVQIYLKDGTRLRTSHTLSFDREIQEGVTYNEVNPQ